MADKPGVASSFPDHSWDNDGNLILTGSANTYVATTARKLFGYFRGLRICGRIPATSTGASTLKVDEGPAVAIRKAGNTAIANGDLVSGHYYDFIYDDANVVFQVDPGSAQAISAGGGIDITGGVVSTTIKRRSITDITTGDTVTTADRATRVRILSGTGTLAFQALATLGNGFWCIIENNGTGDVTLDPNGAETIDGLSSWILYPNGCILLTVTASDITSVLLRPMTKRYTVNDTWTKPGAGHMIEVSAWGAGGSGGRGSATISGGGGGGGAYANAKFAFASVSAAVSVTIGAGGASKTVNTAGDAGGDTTFGAYLTAFGGRGGSVVAGGAGGGGGGQLGAGTGGTGGAPNLSSTAGTSNTGGGGGNGGATGTQGGVSIFGGGGGGGGDVTVASVASGGASLWGGGGGGAGTETSGTMPGGVSRYAGNGGTGNFDANNAVAGSAPAGGGGGSETGNSGAGARGEMVVTVS